MNKLTILILVALCCETATAQDICRSCVEEGDGCWTCKITPEQGAFTCNIANGYCYLEAPYCAISGGCFLGDVGIATPDGDVAIRDIGVGDRVISLDVNGEERTSIIVAKYCAEAWSYYEINHAIRVTETHPFRVGDKWVMAADISVGDGLTLKGGSTVPVESIRFVERGVRVYNISVGETETFYAGGIFVHNKPPVPSG